MPAGWAAAAAAVGGALISADAANSASNKQQSASRAALDAQQRQTDLSRLDTAPYRDAGSASMYALKRKLGLPGSADPNDPRLTAIRDSLIGNADAQHQAKYGMSIFDQESGLSAPGERAKFDDQIRNQAQQQFAAQYGDPSTASPDGGELNRQFTVNDFWKDPVTSLGYQFGLDEGRKGLDRMAGAHGLRNSGATLKALTRFGEDYAGSKAAESKSRFMGDQDSAFNKFASIAGLGQVATANQGNQAGQAAMNMGNIMTAEGNARGAASIAKGNAFGQGFNTVGNWWNQQNTMNKMNQPQQQNQTPYFQYSGYDQAGGNAYG